MSAPEPNSLFELHEGPDGHYGLDLTGELARFDGRLFGGAGLAASVAAMEAVSGRGALWVTTQFVGQADMGERIDCHAEVLAEGRNVTQARVTATVGDRIIFAALGSTARQRDDAFGHQFGTMPDVPSPDECESWRPHFPVPTESLTPRGPFATAEFRQTESADGASMMWARIKGGPQSRATIAYLGDFVPSAVLRVAGRNGGGTSLDNSIRFGIAPQPDTDWVLIETVPYLGDSGFVHGAARLWSADGLMLAVASQTAVARIFE